MQPVTARAAALAAVVTLACAPAQAIEIVFDYRLDTAGFYTPDKRAVMDQVASIFEHNITNSLLAGSNLNAGLGFNRFIMNQGFVSYPNTVGNVSGYNVAADTVVFFASATDLDGSILGLANLGTARPNARFGSNFFNGFGGQLAFDTSVRDLGTLLNYAPLGIANPYVGQTRPQWYVDNDIRDFEMPAAELLPIDPGNPGLGNWTLQQPIDFASVVMHEMGHVFGLRHVDDPADAMFPIIGGGTRKFFTADDWQAMQARGWNLVSLTPDLNQVVPPPVPEPQTWGLMALCLPLVGAKVHRRARAG